MGAHPILAKTAEVLGPKTKEQHIKASQQAGHGGGGAPAWLLACLGVLGDGARCGLPPWPAAMEQGRTAILKLQTGALDRSLTISTAIAVNMMSRASQLALCSFEGTLMYC